MSSTTAKALLQSAVDEGAIGAMSMQALNLVDIGNAINAGMGVSIDNIRGETMLTSLLIDDSGSIRFVPGNSQAVREGHNKVIDSLLATKQSGNILATCQLLNGGLLYPYSTLDQVIRLDSHNYNPLGGTPLFDRALISLGSTIAKQQEFSDNGQLARSASLFVSDANDEHSVHATADDCRKVIEDMLRSETHIIAAMGIDDGRTDFYEVFSGRTKREVEDAINDGTLDKLEPAGGMGIWPIWVLTPKNTPSEIRKAFQTFSQSAVRASQGGASFSQVAIGGFGI